MPGTKSVTVQAQSEAEAIQKAEQANPDWVATRASKPSDDKNSRMWQVSMQGKPKAK
jgi:hypothetical protein